MSDDEKGMEGGEQEESPETEDIDIEIEPTKSTGGSRGVWFVILLIIILAALAWYALWAKQQADLQALQEKEARVQQYRMQELQIGKQLNKALESLEAGNVSAAIAGLEKATTQLRTLASKASSNDDSEEAARIQLTLNETKKALTELEEKQNELAELTREKLTSLQRKLGVSPQEAPKSTEEAPEESEETEAKEETKKPEAGPPIPTPPGPGPPIPAPR
ncbi:MAG: hypothetical protein KAW89_10090 [Armatimonadetes bacterium]|nr:hypothetical protein [Armatimonadota bacterium]